MAGSDKLAEIKRRYRDDPNMYWVSEVDWLLGEVERLTIDNRRLTEMWDADRETLTVEIERLRIELHRVAESRRGQRERAECAEAEIVRLREALCEIRAIVDKQADDEGLWFLRVTASEAYLQRKLRSLHAKIERLTAC